MRGIAALLCFASLCPAQEPTVSTGGLKLVPRKEYEEAATGALKAIANPFDPAHLDRYIARYPHASGAAVAFAMRASFLRGSPVADEYHRFLARYADRAGSRLATSDLFQLYRREHRLSSYLDFMRRYPAAPESAVARLHVEQLAFELARALNTSTDYDAYARLFPGAAQRVLAETLAEERAIEEERALYEAERARNPDGIDDWVNRRLRNFVFASRDMWACATQAEPTRQSRRYVEENVFGGKFDSKSTETRHYLAQRVARIYSVVRSLEAYRMHAASDQILAETRHQELMTQLAAIRNELVAHREQMQTLLREEFTETRRVLEAGFEALVKEHRLDRQVLLKGFTAVATGLDQLHKDLVAVHGEIRRLRVSVDNVDEGIREANARLARLDRQLSVVNANLRQVNANLVVGFDRVAFGIENLRADMNANFDRQAAIAIEQLAVAETSLDVQMQTLYTVDRGFQQVDMTLRAGFTRIEDATWGAASQIVRSHQQMGARLARRPKKRKRGPSKELLGAVLGSAATVAGAGPILGPVLGDMAGQLLVDGNVDPLALGRTAVAATAVKKFAKVPGAARIAGSLYDDVLGRRQQNYARTAQAFEQRTGVRRPQSQPWPELVTGYSTPAEFRRLEQRIAELYGTRPDVVRLCAERIY
ncbi:MAG: hypothetical protein AAGD14_01915 [Planctomycetota bacterium]